MALRALAVLDVMRGSPFDITINNSVAAEVLAVQSIKDDVPTVSEEFKQNPYELEDGKEKQGRYASKIIFEFTFSEIVQADITALRYLEDADVIVATNEGGANGTGITFTLAACDEITCVIEDFKTKITAIKTVASKTTLPYTIADNAA